MIAPYLLCGSLVLLSYTCVVTSNDNTCLDVNGDGICDDQQPPMQKNSIGYSLDGLSAPAALVVTPLLDATSGPCIATLGLGRELHALTGSLAPDGFDLWGGGLALRARRNEKCLDYAAMLVLAQECIPVTLTPRAGPDGATH